MRSPPSRTRTDPERPELAPLPPESFAGTEIAVVLPTLNEEHGLEATYHQVPFAEFAAAGWKVRPLVVDGGSTDGTLGIADRLGIPVLHQRSRGKGGAVRESLDWLRSAGVRYAIMLDADTTYPGEMVGRVVELLRCGAGLVVGIRQPLRTKPVTIRDLVHRSGNAVLNYVAGQVSGHAVLDLCSGFWGLDLRLQASQHLSSTGFEVESELFLRAYRERAQVVQIPIPYTERVGQAKLRAFHDGARILVTVLRQAGGFIKSPPPDERVPSIAPLREVLAACFVHGGSNLVVVADRSRQVEAEELMGRFAGTHIASSLILRPSPVGATRDPAEIEGPQFRRAMVVTLPSATLDGPERGQQTEVLLPGAEAAIRVRLSLPLSLVTPSDPATPELLSWMSRSGGFADVTRPRLQSPGRGLLRSMLAAPGLDQELQYLFANGMRGTVIEGLDAALAETSSRYGVRMLEQGVGSKSQ